MRPHRLPARSLLVGGVALIAALVFATRARPRAEASADAQAASLAGQEALHEISSRLASIERADARRERGSVDPQALREIVSQAVSEQMRAPSLRGTAGSAAPAVVVESPEDNTRRAVAFDAGRALIEARLQTGVWRAADARDIRHLLIAMTPERREEIMTRLTLAINAQELRDEVEGASY